MVLVLKMKTLLFLALTAVAVVCSFERSTAAQLRAELATLRHENSDLAGVRREHARLQQLQTVEARRAKQKRPAASLNSPAPENRAQSPAALVVGEWHSPTAWGNRGQITPVAAIETALWAAAGGDLAALQKLLYLDDGLRAKAETLRARLPDASRATYSSAEHLLAAFATKSLPLGDAQLVWNHQSNADEAAACLFVKNPEYVPSPPVESPLPETRAEAIARAAAIKETRAKDKRPPMAPPNEAIRALYLVLRRTDAGWQLVASPGAVDKIAKEIAGTPVL